MAHLIFSRDDKTPHKNCEPNDKSREKVAPALAHLWRTKRGGNGASNTETEPPSQADRGSAGEKRSSVATLPSLSPPKNKQEATESELFQPIRTLFFGERAKGGTFAGEFVCHHRVAQSDTKFLFLFDNRYT